MSIEEPTLPPAVRRRYVLDGERLVMAIHQHPVVVAEPVATAVGVLLLVVLVDANVSPSAAGIVDVLWWVWFVAVARALWMVWEWRKQWVIATDKRLMMTYGFIIRKVAMMPLGKITDMSYHRSIPGRIFGWGTYVMESAGQQQALSEIHFVPEPDRHYRALCTEIFGLDDAQPVAAESSGRGDDAWDGDAHEDDGELLHDIVEVEPGPMGIQPARVSGRRARAPRNGYDTADLPVVDSPVAQDAEAHELLSSWERFARRYDDRPEPGYRDGTSIYRSGDDTLS